MALRFHDWVELRPLVAGTADGGGVDVLEQSGYIAGFEPFEEIVGTGEVGLAIEAE